MNTHITKLTPMLETPELPKTIDFYTKTLGFICENYEEEWGWAHLSKDGFDIMFTTPNEHRKIPQPIMSGSIYLRTEDVNAWWDKLSKTCKICYPIEDFDYGMREFGIFDNNGYLIQFGEVIKD